MRHMLTREQVQEVLGPETDLTQQIAAGAIEPAAAAGGTFLFDMRDVKRLAAELRLDAQQRRAGGRRKPA
jgi:hypothetical protein